MAQLPISLERPVGEEDDSQFGDFVEDITAESPYALATLNLRREDIDRTMAAYANLSAHVQLRHFFDNVPELLGAAHLVITRSGASR